MRAALAVLVVACSGCVPMPMRLYVPDPATGTIEYLGCNLNHHVPHAVRVERGGVGALVSMTARGPGGYVEIRYDVPVGHVLALQGDRVRLEPLDGAPPVIAVIPKVSPVDSPMLNDSAPHLAHLMLPVDAPLPGRERHGVALHYWVAARFAGAPPDAVVVTLPPVTIDGRPAEFPPVRFDRRLFPVVLVFNC